MEERDKQREQSIELLEQKAKVLRHVADTAHGIEADPANRARGEDLELQAESGLGATESAISCFPARCGTLFATRSSSGTLRSVKKVSGALSNRAPTP